MQKKKGEHLQTLTKSKELQTLIEKKPTVQ